MAYTNNNQQQGEKSGYDRTKDVVIFKACSKTEKRYLNVEVYSYDGGATKIRIRPTVKNTNPEADKNKQWINMKGISQLTVEEANGLIKSLTDAVKNF